MKSSNTQNRVKELVTQFPSLIENYSSSTLVSYYWKYVEGAKTVEHIAHMSSPEAITRAFRRLVNKGEIVLPKHIKDRNNQYQEEFRLEFTPL